MKVGVSFLFLFLFPLNSLTLYVCSFHLDFSFIGGACFSQTPLLPNCLKEGVEVGVTQQNITIRQGAGPKTRPLTHLTGLPITESLKSWQRRPSSMRRLTPARGNSPQATTAPASRRLPRASNLGVSRNASQSALASRGAFLTP